jgi:hypothetical protein
VRGVEYEDGDWEFECDISEDEGSEESVESTEHLIMHGAYYYEHEISDDGYGGYEHSGYSPDDSRW